MIQESAIYECLDAFRGYSYGSKNVSWPFVPPGVRVRDRGSMKTDCSSFAQSLILGAAEKSGAEFSWGKERWRQAQVTDISRPLSAITAYVEAGLADRVDGGSVPSRWWFCQGWRQLGKSPRGHQFIVEDVDGDQVLILEANNRRDFDGVGRRGIGHIDETGPDKPIGWEHSPCVSTWQQIRSYYGAKLGACALRVVA